MKKNIKLIMSIVRVNNSGGGTLFYWGGGGLSINCRTYSKNFPGNVGDGRAKNFPGVTDFLPPPQASLLDWWAEFSWGKN